MATSSLTLVAALFSILVTTCSPSSVQSYFLQCLHSTPYFMPNTTSYSTILRSTIRNQRFTSSTTPKPILILTPNDVSQVQAAVFCCRVHGLQLKVRSGGHDFAGLSSTSDVPFVMLDLVHLASISIDAKGGTAWVQAGATVGQLCYRIAEMSSTYAFPAGIGPTVGVGGQFSGGGYGPLMRKYGLSADNIVDATLVNANGQILNRKTMGEDLFWAIRGGGAVNFGVILSWKITLVPVPPTVTIFRVYKTLEQNATSIFQKWQQVAHQLPREVFIQVVANVVNSTQDGQRTIQLTFRSLFLGSAENLVATMDQYFPELGLKRQDCNETKWVQSVLLFGDLPVYGPLDVLLERVSSFLVPIVTKSDYVTEPISEVGLMGLWKLLLEVNTPQLLITPYGGRMDDIPEWSIPFPHRKGKIFTILYMTYWLEGGDAAIKEHTDWIRRLYGYMTPYVSKSPRSTYVNYRDIELGQSKNGTTSYSIAKVWGDSYFNNNYDKLVKVKTMVDPTNFFRNEQSIPTMRK